MMALSLQIPDLFSNQLGEHGLPHGYSAAACILLSFALNF